jgi:hypothetical protein
MSPYDGAALLWYVQNSKFFSLKLHEDNRVLLVRYDDLVTNPEEWFKRVFSFIGCHFSSQYIDGIYDSSIGTDPLVTINANIEPHCEEMLDRLNEAYALSIGKTIP